MPNDDEKLFPDKHKWKYLGITDSITEFHTWQCENCGVIGQAQAELLDVDKDNIDFLIPPDSWGPISPEEFHIRSQNCLTEEEWMVRDIIK